MQCYLTERQTRTPRLFTAIDPQINAERVHTWSFPPAFPLDVAEFSFGQSYDFRVNRHDYFEMMYVLSGKAEIQIQERRLLLGTGDLVIIGAGLDHSLISSPHTSLQVLDLFFLPEIVRSTSVGGDDVAYLTPFLVQDSAFPHIVPATSDVPAKVAELIRNIQRDLPASSSRARLSAVTNLKMALTLLGDFYSAFNVSSETFGRQERDLRRIGPLFEHLERHYGEPLHVADAARLCAMSASHFMSFFKRVTGQSFLAYVNQFRIAKAHVLLTSTDQSISEIAQELGFCDQSHFGETFRRVVGMSPRAYRRLTAGSETASQGTHARLRDLFGPRPQRIDFAPEPNGQSYCRQTRN